MAQNKLTYREMDKIRIGKDITVTGSITVNGIAVCLEGLDLVAVATSKSDIMREYPLELSVSGSSFSITFRGRDMIGFLEDGTVEYKIPLGKYIISLWQNRGELYEAAWDVQVFQLVSHTFKENDDEDGLDVGHCDLGVIDFTNKFLLEVTSRLEAIDAAKMQYDIMRQGLGEYKAFFEEVKEAYESGALNGKDLTWDDLTDEQKESLRGKPGKDGKDGLDGGLLFPDFNFDPESGELLIVGTDNEMSRFDYDEEESELIIKFQ